MSARDSKRTTVVIAGCQARRKLYCRWCGGELVGDDAGGWLHQNTMSRYCPRRLAEPDLAELQP